MCIMPFVAASSYRSVNEDLGISSEEVSSMLSDSFDLGDDYDDAWGVLGRDDDYDEAVVGVFGRTCPSGQFRNRHIFACARIENNIGKCETKEERRESRRDCEDGAVSTSCVECKKDGGGQITCAENDREVLRFNCQDKQGYLDEGKLRRCERDGMVNGQSSICKKTCEKDYKTGVCQCKVCNSNFAIE